MSFRLPLLFAIVAVAGAAGTSPAKADEAADIAALIAVDKRQQRAYVDRDWAALEEIFTDDYVLVLWDGSEHGKRKIIDGAKAPDSNFEINETSDWKVRVHGDTGIVVASLRQKGVLHGKPFDSVVKFSDTYIRENGQWRNVHAHASKAVDVK
jgi:ketosteroid isomerase-like protein